jgi:hypothetical protein
LHNNASNTADSIGYLAQWVSEQFTKNGNPKESSVIKMNWKL